MVQVIKNQGYSTYRSLTDLLAGRRRQTVGVEAKTLENYQPKGREIHDTVEIKGAGKIVNLARGIDLAAEIRAEKNPDKVREMVAAGTSDIKRIGRLFQETFTTLFSLFKRF